MVIRLFFVALMLLSSRVAFGAGLSAGFSVEVAPPSDSINTSQCPAAAPAEAQRAGFTAMVFCQDFTQPIPNNAGTGLAGGWLSCIGVPATVPQWTMYGSAGGVTCGPPDIMQKTDPTTNTLAMFFQYLPSYQAGTSKIWIQTDDFSSLTPGQGNYFVFPQASLMEITYRDNIDNIHSTCSGSDLTDFWASSHEGGALSGVNEYDVIENWRSGVNCQYQVTSSVLHNWNGDGIGGADVAAGVWDYPGYGNFSSWGPVDPSGVGPTSSYHTYGLMTTTNGKDNMVSCGYIDHVLVNCVSFPGLKQECTRTTVNQSGCWGQRQYPIFWVGSANGQPLAGPVQAWVKSWRAWSCPAWNATDAKIAHVGVNTCYGPIISAENASPRDTATFAEMPDVQRKYILAKMDPAIRALWKELGVE